MNAPRFAAILVFGHLALYPAGVNAQQPKLVNAQLQTRSAAAGLEREFRALVGAVTQPAWIGYSAPLIEGDHRMCCYDSGRCCGRCGLEEKRSGATIDEGERKVQLEAGDVLFVLFRAEAGRVQKIRTFSADCELDAGGLPFYWLTEVQPRDSVALLASYASATDPERRERGLADGAIAAIAFHRDPAADRTLEQFVESSRPESLRSQTAFWLGVARGRRGYEVLRRLVRDDPSEKVRDKAVFALSQSKEPEALTAMIETARGDRSSHVRGQALFWLSQKAGAKAAAAITDAIENDPETEVKKKAVFALSQLPADDGVPKLIEVARSNRNAAVRKQAIFWLGQSRDSRALAFFEEVLLRK
jgi:hypothetical protein